MTVDEFISKIRKLKIEPDLISELNYAPGTVSLVLSSFEVVEIERFSEPLKLLIEGHRWSDPFPGSYHFTRTIELWEDGEECFATDNDSFIVRDPESGEIHECDSENLDFRCIAASNLNKYLDALYLCAECQRRRWLEEISVSNKTITESYVLRCVEASGSKSSFDHYATILWL